MEPNQPSIDEYIEANMKPLEDEIEMLKEELFYINLKPCPCCESLEADNQQLRDENIRLENHIQTTGVSDANEIQRLKDALAEIADNHYDEGAKYLGRIAIKAIEAAP